MAEKQKRILIFSFMYYPREVGGAEVAIKEITDRLPTAEYQFDMVTLHLDRDLPAHEKIGNVNVHRVGRGKYFFTVVGAWKAGKLRRDNRK